MVDNNEDLIQKMTGIGFSSHEAKAYLSLLSRQPATAYEIAKASGIPTSKVYEVIGKLIDKGVVSLIDQGKTRQYIAMDPDEFLDRCKSTTEALIDSIQGDLKALRGKEDVSHIWNITRYGFLLDKGRRMIQGAARTLLVSLWREELAHWEADLQDAVRRGVDVAVVHFGATTSSIGQFYPHPIEDTLYKEKGCRGIALVADGAQVLIGTVFSDEQVEGAWSSNRGFVTLAEDYVKHDIYIMKIVQRFDNLLVERFGPHYVKLRNIYKDEEWINEGEY